MSKARDTSATAETNTALVAAITDKILKIKSIYFSTDTATTFSLVNSATHDAIFGPMYVAATGGVHLGPDEIEGMYQTTDGEGIDWNTSATGNTVVEVGYEVV